MSNIELFEGLDTKKKNYTQFPDMEFLPHAIFPDFGKFSNDEDNIIQHLVVHACQILNKSSSFHNELKLLVIDKIFMGCNLIVTLQRTSRFIVKWTSNSITFKAIGKSLNGFLKYLKGLQSNIFKRLNGSFKVQDLYGNLISYRYLVFPRNDFETIVPNKDMFIGELNKFQFFPNDRENVNILFTQYQAFHTYMIKLCSESRRDGAAITEIQFLKKAYHISGPEMQRFLDILVSIPTSEAICETWGSVIENVSEGRARSNDGSSDEMVYGTVENRVLVMLNGPPSGYKNNDKLLKHCLERLYGLNYQQNFIVKTSKFKTMSKVLYNIQEDNMILVETISHRGY